MVENNFIRNIFYYKQFYLDFFSSLKPEVQKKFNWTLQLIATIDRVPENTLNIYLDQLVYMKLG